MSPSLGELRTHAIENMRPRVGPGGTGRADGDIAIRLGTWNCRLDIDGKRAAFECLALDVAVVPESAQHPLVAQQSNVSHAWIGTNHRKGLGVFGFNGWRVTPRPEVDALPWCLPVGVQHPDGYEFTLLAIWTVRRQGDGRPGYAGQFGAVIDRWRQILADGPAIIAGDLNASLQGSQWRPHRRNLDALAAVGVRSAHDLVHGPTDPANEPATLRWIGPGRKPYHYHCDYVFVSASLAPGLRSVEVGSLAEWVESGLSDHCPVVAELGVPLRD